MILLRRNESDENFNISQQTVVLERGEPFVDLTTNSLYIGNGEDQLNALSPIAGGGIYTAEHSYSAANGHTFSINENVNPNFRILSFICLFNRTYTAGESIKLVINGTTYNVGNFKLSSGIPAVSSSFVAKTVGQVYIYKPSQGTIQMFMNPAISIWSNPN